MLTVIKSGDNKSTILKLLEKIKSKKGVDTKKYSGVITLKENPVAIQKKMRDEWE